MRPMTRSTCIRREANSLVCILPLQETRKNLRIVDRKENQYKTVLVNHWMQSAQLEIMVLVGHSLWTANTYFVSASNSSIRAAKAVLESVPSLLNANSFILESLRKDSLTETDIASSPVVQVLLGVRALTEEALDDGVVDVRFEIGQEADCAECFNTLLVRSVLLFLGDANDLPRSTTGMLDESP